MRTPPALVALLSLVGSAAADPAPAKPKDPIEEAIRKGSDHLRAETKSGAVLRGGHPVGHACLVGLALIEAGDRKNDEAVAALANYVRDQALGTFGTYEVSLALMFLDRVGGKADDGLIQFLGVRLLTGQTAEGAWSYSCPGRLDPAEHARLKAQLVKKDARMTARPDAKKGPDGKPDPVRPAERDDLPVDPDAIKKPDPKGPPKPADRDDLPVDPDAIKKPDPKTPADPKKPDPKEPADPKEPKSPLHPAAAAYLKMASAGRAGEADILSKLAGGDHSNTQFATVGLWVARRHGVPADAAIGRLDAHYRKVQSEDGGWGYGVNKGGSAAAMTCAGIMALAMNYGVRDAALKTKPAPAGREAENDPTKDKALEAALRRLGTYLADAADKEVPAGGGKGRFRRSAQHGDLYFMWSLERVGVMTGLNTIGKIDWYGWGADGLVDLQKADGGWGSSHHDTAFAMLFLCRANFTQDLSASLKGKLIDPGTATLRGGSGLEKFLPGGGTPKPDAASKPDPAGEPQAGGPKEPKRPAVEPRPLPPAAGSGEAGKLAKALLDATDQDLPPLLAGYRDAKGAAYTDALARAAAKGTGDGQKLVRQALAERLSRMGDENLREFLADEDAELRRAAALGCAAKDKGLVPDLIKALGDKEGMVVRAAKASLVRLTGVDHGPAADAKEADKAQAIVAWQRLVGRAEVSRRLGRLTGSAVGLT